MDQKEIQTYLLELNRLDKRLGGLYRRAAVSLGMSDCAMWILYMLLLENHEMTQQELGEYLQFPKQTINSSVGALRRQEYVQLCPIPGTKNKKAVSFTAKGRQFAGEQVGKAIEAEGRAISRMSREGMDRLMELYKEYLELMQEEFEKEGF
ncbi:MAG: MarR family transcriptional regulator [Lachnospiraceae bacterium]|nr:MarR family transcriptional regulator [Lachnospiraceae bacterium]